MDVFHDIQLQRNPDYFGEAFSPGTLLIRIKCSLPSEREYALDQYVTVA